MANIKCSVNVGLMSECKIRVSYSGQVSWSKRSNGHGLRRSEGQPGGANDISKDPVAKRKKKSGYRVSTDWLG